MCPEIKKITEIQPFALQSKATLWYAKAWQHKKNWCAALPSGLLPLLVLLLSIMFLYSGKLLFKSEYLNGEFTVNGDRNRDRASRLVPW